MYNQFVKTKKVAYDPELPDCYIFDIDGTLAHMAGRSPYDYDKVHTDTVDYDIARILETVSAHSKIYILSGRDSGCREVTRTWLLNNVKTFDGLFMREEGDKRKDSIVKKELYEEHIKGKYNVLGVFDDRNQVVDLWRSLGLTCYQVDYGFF